MFVIFFISALAETNRAPFDLPEGESELVAGFFVEYSSMSFALFFLGEYANMILMSSLTTILFLGGWYPPLDIAPFNWLPGPAWFALKVAAILFCFIWVRATFPRYRYDQLMRLGWKIFLPTSLVAVVIIGGNVTFINAQARPPFDALDADKSGYLEAPELAAVTLPAGLDKNQDGLVSWQEYRAGEAS
jgi:NADH:ubiquinone oxidoreductase subunit H